MIALLWCYLAPLAELLVKGPRLYKAAEAVETHSSAGIERIAHQLKIVWRFSKPRTP
jgi:hypothetical protein